jgi:hypothetical protein
LEVLLAQCNLFPVDADGPIRRYTKANTPASIDRQNLDNYLTASNDYAFRLASGKAEHRVALPECGAPSSYRPS